MTLESTEAREDMAQTRSQALRARGYSEDIIAGTHVNGSNGHEPEPDAPLCEICGEALPAEKVAAHSKTCGPECAKEHRIRRRKALNGSKPPVASPAPVVSNGSTTNVRDAISPIRPNDGFLALLASLGPAQVRSAVVGLGEDEFCITRTNGAT
jgi:hypothetical protein